MNGIATTWTGEGARAERAIDKPGLDLRPRLMAKLADCGVTFLDSPEDVIQMALATSASIRIPRRADLASRKSWSWRCGPTSGTSIHRLLASVRPTNVRGIAWSSDYLVAKQRALEDGTGAHLAFTLPKEGSNITYNALLIPADAPHPQAAHEFLNFILDPKIIAEITNDLRYGSDKPGGAAVRPPEIRGIRWSIRRRDPRAAVTCRRSRAPITTGCARARGRGSDRPVSAARLRPGALTDRARRI